MMIKKSIIAIVAIIAAVGIVFAAYGGSENNNPTNDSSNLEQQQSTNAATSNTNTNTATKKVDKNKVISASKAKQLAQKYILVATAKTGVPKLIKSGETLIYVVPVVDNGQVVGEIEIDAQTGANMGGAGGAP
jgi:uncharacterized membrane protein YkoI